MATYNPHAFGDHFTNERGANHTGNRRIGNKVKLQSSSKNTSSFNSMKYIVSLIFISLLVTSVLIITTNASTSYSERALVEENEIIVSSGDSLWSIAKRYYNNEADTGYVVYLIKERNLMTTSHIEPGQRLILPNLE